MRAITYAGVGRVALREVADPAIEDPRDAIVEVALTSVCGSDLHVFHGREVGCDDGTIMGHECVGRVIEVGEGVSPRALGMRVSVPFASCCGACYFCTRGLSARCRSGHLFGWVQQGRGLQGAQAERVRVPLADATLFPLPDDVSNEVGLLLCDVLPTGQFCAGMAEVSPAGTYVVIGCGPVGLMAVAAAVERGAGALYAVDTVDERLALAERFGATAIDARSAAAVEVVRAATDGRGADAALECVGSPAAGALAFELVRPGGIIAAVGVHHETAFPFSPAQAYDHNLTYRIGRCPARSLQPELLPLARTRGDALTAIFTHHAPLAQGVEAYAMFDGRRDGCIKVALEP